MPRAPSRALTLAALVLGLTGCAASRPDRTAPDEATAPNATVTPNATRETRALFDGLRGLAGRGVLFGHHDDLAYGTAWRDVPGGSDVKATAGDYPALYGWDVSRLFNGRRPDEPDPQSAAELRAWMLEGYARGGVATMCWHMANPVTDGSFYDTTRAVYQLLPGGALHDDYKAKLDVVAAFAASLRAPDGSLVPVIFRPFHEHTGSWFWWGRRHSTVGEFAGLWRFTVDYLRGEKGVRNFLYAYSTDVFDSEAAYLERYPGDAYIDVLGFDDYHSFKTAASRDTAVFRLRTVARLADARGKIAALTETGVEGVPDPAWWTGVLLPALTADSLTRRVSSVLVWRNAVDRAGHFYAPHPGHPSVPDFVRFREDPRVLFEAELPDLYRRRAR